MNKLIKIGNKRYWILFPDLLRSLSTDEYEELFQSIKASGIKVPVILNPSRGVIDGLNRLLIAQKLELTAVPELTIDPGDDEATKALALELNLSRRHLSIAEVERTKRSLTDLRHAISERQKRVEKMRRDGKTIKEIAAKEGISSMQARRDCDALGAVPDEGFSVNEEGHRYPVNHGNKKPAVPTYIPAIANILRAVNDEEVDMSNQTVREWFVKLKKVVDELLDVATETTNDP